MSGKRGTTELTDLARSRPSTVIPPQHPTSRVGPKSVGRSSSGPVSPRNGQLNRSPVRGGVVPTAHRQPRPVPRYPCRLTTVSVHPVPYQQHPVSLEKTRVPVQDPMSEPVEDGQAVSSGVPSPSRPPTRPLLASLGDACSRFRGAGTTQLSTLYQQPLIRAVLQVCDRGAPVGTDDSNTPSARPPTDPSPGQRGPVLPAELPILLPQRPSRTPLLSPSNDWPLHARAEADLLVFPRHPSRPHPFSPSAARPSLLLFRRHGVARSSPPSAVPTDVRPTCGLDSRLLCAATVFVCVAVCAAGDVCVWPGQARQDNLDPRRRLHGIKLDFQPRVSQLSSFMFCDTFPACRTCQGRKPVGMRAKKPRREPGIVLPRDRARALL